MLNKDFTVKALVKLSPGSTLHSQYFSFLTGVHWYRGLWAVNGRLLELLVSFWRIKPNYRWRSWEHCFSAPVPVPHICPDWLPSYFLVFFSYIHWHVETYQKSDNSLHWFKKHWNFLRISCYNAEPTYRTGIKYRVEVCQIERENLHVSKFSRKYLWQHVTFIFLLYSWCMAVFHSLL